MSELIINDGREYIFPLFLVETNNNEIYLESRQFLGTAFFVSKQGDAITANHVMPQPADLPENKRVVAIVQHGAEQKACWITHFATFAGYDFALIHVNIDNTKYLTLSDCEVPAGSDIQIVGIPKHEVYSAGKEMRLLKGYVTLAFKQLELNIAIPLGMSGSPVFMGSNVVAFATGTINSEEIDDYSEEVEKITDRKEQITITKVSRFTHYGLALPFYKLKNQSSPIFDNKTLKQFIDERNT